MKQTLKPADVVAVGFMLFAFFLGAGNIIFPPQVGQLSGDNFLPAMFGFLVTAVGLPLVTVIAVAVAGGSWDKLTELLPKSISTLIAVLIFIVIGPAFAAPRAGLVAYEMGVNPFLSDAAEKELIIFSILFFSIAMFFSWSRGRLIDVIGKFLTPALCLGLIVLAVMVVMNPQGEVLAASGEYATQPFTKGFIEGYNTMDTFAALMFGMLLVDAMRKKGVTDTKIANRYLTKAAFIAALGLAFVYVSLVYLGVTSGGMAAKAGEGASILTVYVQALFGSSGQLVLSAIVLLACLTTVIGLISACSDYFSSLTPIPYKAWVVIIGVACGLVANVGLSQLISLSVPVLYALYPVAIALVSLTFLRNKFPNPSLAYMVVIGVAFAFALLDVAKVVKMDVSALDILPLYSVGMGWLPPTLLSIVLMLFVGKSSSPELANEVA